MRIAKNAAIGIFIWILAAIFFLTGAAFAETTTGKAANTNEAQKGQLDEQKDNYDAHRSYVKVHFDDNEMDFWFGWVLGNISGGGCQVGEAMYVAGGIKDGEPKSWQDEWEIMAVRIEDRAEKTLAAGHKMSASDAYKRACMCYRAALVSMLPDNPKFKKLAAKARYCMQTAGKLCDPPLEYIEIPFENTVLPGYFMKANKDGKKCKTLLMIGGGETFAEDNYFYIGQETVKRGYNFMTVDLPGQGTLPMEKHFFRYDTEVPMKAALDYICKRPEVDTEKLAVFGISNGGYFVPRTAMFDKRIKAVVVSAAVVDNYRMFKQMPFALETQEQIDKWPPFKHNIISTVTWRWGLDPSDVKGQVAKNVKFQFDPKKITCPFLILIGEGEYANEETKRQQKECMDGLPNPNKKFVVTPLNEGASEHCINLNRALMSQVVFDWLDETFDKTQASTKPVSKKK
jgi:alpha-beta hydrolase superfamily lysophospholipase